MNFCPNCGAKLPNEGDNKFCMNCGARIPIVHEEAAAPPVFVGVPVPPLEPTTPAPPPLVQPQGEDILSMIEKAQAPALPFAGEPEDLFASAVVETAGPLFDDQPEALPASRVDAQTEDLFANAVPAKAAEPNMFDTAVMQSVNVASDKKSTVSNEKSAAARAVTPPKTPAQEPSAASPVGLFAGGPPPAALQQEQSPLQAQELFQNVAALAEAEFDAAPAVEPARDLPDSQAQTGSSAASRRAAAPVLPPPRVHSAKQEQPRPLREATPAPEPDPARGKRLILPPPIALPPQETSIKKPSVIGRILTGFAILIVFLVVCAGTILTMLYFQNRPAKTIEAFAEAVVAGDVATLNKLSVVEDKLPEVARRTPTDAEWKAFCAAFSDEAALKQLKSQLLMMAEETTGEVYTYPAVTVESKPFILFIEQYSVHIQVVDLVAPGAVAGTVAQLDGVDYTGQPQADGELYENLMPGRYQCRLVPPGVEPQNVPLVDVEIFGVEAPNYLSGEIPQVEISIGNCASDDAVLYVNEAPVAEKPLGGIVVIPKVALGSTIRISAIKDSVTMEASVVFNDLNTTQLLFADYTSQGEPPPVSSSIAGEATITPEAINGVMGSFYPSYLECINQQKIDGIKNTTAAANTSLAARITSDGNASNLFEYVGAACDAESLKTTQSGELPAVQFNVQFQYRYKPREGEAAMTASQNYQSVEMVYSEGQWLVNKMTFVSEGDFNSHTLAVFE